MSSSGFFNLFLRLQLPQEKQLRGSVDLSLVNSSRKMQENTMTMSGEVQALH